MDTSVQKLCSTILDLPPSCIEFSRKAPDYFVVGTYNLEREDGPQESVEVSDEEDDNKPSEKRLQSRNGSLVLFKVVDNELLLVHTVTHPSAILDLHFSPHSSSLFAVASSTGSISLYTLQEEPRHALVHVQTFQSFPTSTLILSLAWHPTFPGLLGVTLSTGTVSLLQSSSDYTSLSYLRDDLSPHSDLEAWTLAFTPPLRLMSNPRSSPQSVYSGGDDSRLRCVTFPTISSLRHTAKDLALMSPGGLKGMSGHNAGVTAILPLPLDLEAGKDILLTGSYDDHVRVYAAYDYRPNAPSTLPKVLTELKIGGGVWRLKFLRDYGLSSDRFSDKQVYTFIILASCMHAGARILKVKGSKIGEWTIEVVGSFEEHGSMNYGSDVKPAKTGEELDDSRALCVSTSFYDRLLCVWKFETPS